MAAFRGKHGLAASLPKQPGQAETRARTHDGDGTPFDAVHIRTDAGQALSRHPGRAQGLGGEVVDQARGLEAGVPPQLRL